MRNYKAPGVYFGENLHFSPSIVSVETAIPAFIGYTEKAQWKEKDDLRNVPWKIGSMLQYEQFFGYPDPEKESLSVVYEANGEVSATVDETKRSKYLMHYSMQMYFANGGEACWITSVGDYSSREGRVEAQDLKDGLIEAAKINEVTLLVFPDAINLGTKEEYYDVHKQAIQQCALLQDRFTVMDVYHTAANSWTTDISDLRISMSLTANELRCAAVYFPKLYTGINYYYKSDEDATKEVKRALNKIQMLLPASAATVGVYVKIDKTNGVWKAPANVNILNVIRPEFLITTQQLESLNVDAASGKSINVIRSFAGRGPAVIWGSRTLAGNDSEWRYVPIRRFFNMVEESVKHGTEQFVFEPNDRNTWKRVKSIIENYLIQQWKLGALKGAVSNKAFFVHVGLGETMTELDIAEGRMIVIIGMAAVRPAEFTILRITHKMLSSRFRISPTAKLVPTNINRENLVLLDEAEALSGKRTNVQDAHDRYSNQEVSYMLQDVEKNRRMVILVNHKKRNIDSDGLHLK